MGVRAVVVGMVMCFTIVAVLACGAVPNGVSGVKLFAEVAPVGEWQGFSGMTSLCIVIMILRHCVSLKVVTVSIRYGCV